MQGVKQIRQPKLPEVITKTVLFGLLALLITTELLLK
jgi:hypothetical protein